MVTSGFQYVYHGKTVVGRVAFPKKEKQVKIYNLYNRDGITFGRAFYRDWYTVYRTPSMAVYQASTLDYNGLWAELIGKV